MKFRSDIYLGLFFAVCGWIYPGVLFFPINEISAKYYTFWANFLIPINTCLLTYYLDKIVHNQLRFPSFIYSILTGVFLGVYLTTESISIKPVISAYGVFYTGIFETPLIKFFLLLIYLMIFSLNLRFFYLSYKFSKLKLKHIPRFFITMGLGYLFWLILTNVKRIYPYYLYGIDYLAMSLVYTIIMVGYINNRNQLTILPGGLRYLIIFPVENQNTIKIPLVYDFLRRQIFDSNIEDQEITPLLSFTSILLGTELYFIRKIEKAYSPISFKNLQFKRLVVSFYQSRRFRWVLFSKKTSELYHQAFSTIIEQMESSIDIYLKEKERIKQTSEKIEKIDTVGKINIEGIVKKELKIFLKPYY
ncbi:MAG: hypothetical protein K9W44_13985 [Candidatus Lokiarchaeota archaeon]|nr:hypothetical protein [Candidatus Harpocratesius repetitus]